jgi:Na+/proline symporter
MGTLILFVALVSGPLLYVIVSYFGQEARTYEDYHLASRKLDPADVVDTTVAYGLQVAVFTLFATWGFQHGFWTIWVPLFWGSGYLIMLRFLKTGRLDRFLQSENPGTLHQFLSETVNLKAVAVLAAFASLVGITGPAMYEAQFSGDLTARLFAAAGAAADEVTVRSHYAPIFFVAFLVCAAAYMLHGGYRAVVRTDSLQLGIAYVAMVIVLQVLIARFGGTHSRGAATAISLTVFVVSTTLIVVWFKCFPGKRWVSSSPLILAAAISLVGLLYLFTFKGGQPTTPYSLAQFIKDQRFSSPAVMGYLPLLSLLTANAFYQLVDVGQWQRLASIRFDRSDPAAAKEGLSRALIVSAIYSPITWMLAIAFGMLLRYAVPAVAEDPFDALGLFAVTIFKSGSVQNQLLIGVLLAGLIAAMLSTLDSLVASITFTVHNDWLATMTPKLKTKLAGQLLTMIYLIIAFCSYLYLNRFVKNFSDILYCCWSAQLALLPFVLNVIRDKPSSGYAAILSIIAGMILAFVPLATTGWNPPFGPALSPYTHSPILAVIGSALILFFFNKLLPFSPRAGAPNNPKSQHVPAN